MKMTLGGYADNPMGKKNAVFSQRDMFKRLYTEKLDKLLLKYNGKVEYLLYTDKKKDRYFIHMKVFSEVIHNFFYDVVIEFYSDDSVIRSSRSLKDYYVKFYSNDPAFVFTFAHAFIENEIFIEELKPKMSKKAIKDKADTRNPRNEVGYVKSIYFAYLIIKNKGLLEKVHYDTAGKKLDVKELLNSIEHADIKIEKRIKAGDELEREKRREKNSSNTKNPSTDKKDLKSTVGNAIKDPKLSIKNISIISNSKTVGTGRVKTTKRI